MFQGDVRTKCEEKGVAKGVDMFASADEIFEAIVRVRDDERRVEKRLLQGDRGGQRLGWVDFGRLTIVPSQFRHIFISNCTSGIRQTRKQSQRNYPTLSLTITARCPPVLKT